MTCNTLAWDVKCLAFGPAASCWMVLTLHSTMCGIILLHAYEHMILYLQFSSLEQGVRTKNIHECSDGIIIMTDASSKIKSAMKITLTVILFGSLVFSRETYEICKSEL